MEVDTEEPQVGKGTTRQTVRIIDRGKTRVFVLGVTFVMHLFSPSSWQRVSPITDLASPLDAITL